MTPTTMTALLASVSGELERKNSIFEIPMAAAMRAFELEARSPGFDVLGTRVSLPVGPAAGPNTQIAQALLAAYLSGARVFELKTVQLLDRLDIEKPCIDTLDEGYNVEWSTELALEEALAEYLHAWVAIHLLEAAFSRKPRGQLIFNMSVGYTLDGIQSERVNSFIDALTRPAGSDVWSRTLQEAAEALRTRRFAAAFGAERLERMGDRLGEMPESPVHSVTLSTMHGCPPEEIERIAAYLMERKGLSTYVKLNPTLLGYDRVRSILDSGGWSDILIERATFERDLQLTDALALISSLSRRAKKAGVKFGLKLSNTLANRNAKGRLPGEEMYLSGRALFPITTRLAAELAGALDDLPPFSFCGGVSAQNTVECLQAGLGPLTCATELLKPGGYLRLEQMAERALEAMEGPLPAQPDAEALERLASIAALRAEYRKDWKEGRTSIKRDLPLFDCFAAPCVEACPVNQKVPAYIRSFAAGRESEALRIILADNPLPTITALVCDHACTFACARNDYEGPVDIRGMKLACVRAADVPLERREPRAGAGKTAIIGAGPAGLACAYYLALNAYPVVLFEREEKGGGVVETTIPRFRMAKGEVERDVERIVGLGAELRSFISKDLDRGALAAEGFTSVVVASGAPVERGLTLEGGGTEVIGALEFLTEARRNPVRFSGRRNIAVVGGGYTSMDAVRVALRMAGSPKVHLLYRRTRTEMPADRSEVEAALSEGAELHELILPFKIAAGTMTARIMTLGEPDASGRPAPVATDRTMSLPCDLVISAIGEEPDRRTFDRLGITTDARGLPLFDPETLETGVPSVYVAGDAARGPQSIIRAAADGRRAAYAILRRAGIEPAPSAAAALGGASPAEARLSERGRILPSLPRESGDNEATRRVTAEQAAREAERCLSCDAACLRCVEVCPNRANVALPVGAGFTQAIQILHIDTLCNDCGACGFLCPYDLHGLPYRDKPTLFASESAFRGSTNPGFVWLGVARAPDGTLQSKRMLLRVDGEVVEASAGDKTPSGATPGVVGMRELARTVLSGHPYLLEGSTP